MAASRRGGGKRSGSNAGTVFWLTAIVIALFIFALNWGKIQETFKRTNFNDIVKSQGQSDQPQPANRDTPAEKTPAANPASSAPSAKPQPSSPVVQPTQPSPLAPAPKPPSAGEASPSASGKNQGSTVENRGEEGNPSRQPNPSPRGDAGSPAVSLPSVPSLKSRMATLYFVRIDDDGNISRQEVRRNLPISDSPLLDSIGALLQGPNEEELRHRFVSLVPQGTKLISAQMRGSTAVLNFSEAFMYNHYGIEGYAGQLKQIVFTATAFPNVQDVQILIEGQKHDYLGGEGVYIGKPLSRTSF